MRTKYVFGCALAVAVGCSASPRDEGVSQGTAPVTTGTTYRLVTAANTQSCMDARSSGTSDGTQIQEWSCNGTGAQKFKLQAASGGAYTLVNTNSGKCLDVNGAGTADGTKVQLWTCNGTGAQSFRLRDAGSGRFALVNSASQKCIDVSGANGSDGTLVQLWTCNGTNAQAWTLDATDAPPPPPPPPPPTGKCDASNPEQYASASTVWCVDPQVWAAHSAEIRSFFTYGDAVVGELEALFHVTPGNLPFYIVARAPDGGAQTPTRYGPGVEVTGDAFYGDGFWGYLLVLHEFINQWTGLTSGGWPTDFWADHVSAFPNSMDWHVMADLGAKLNAPNLTSASARQKARFYPGGDSVDPRVPMFDHVFDLPGGGFDGWSRTFSLVRGDGMQWDSLGVPNPDVKRSEYVAAYVSLGFGQSVLPIFQAANVCDGSPDRAGDAGYVCTEPVIDAIANAHCAVVAAGKPAADLRALQTGRYDQVQARGACGSACPAECGCDTQTNTCVARWKAR